MTLQDRFGSPYEEFAAFLFAPIGDDSRGMPLTVLSALSQLGLDPDMEARRLKALSHEAATQALVAWIEALPEGEWTSMDARLIAARLLETLPRGRSSEMPPTVSVTALRVPTISPSMLRWLLLVGLAVVVAYGVSRMQDGDSGSMDLGAISTPARTLASNADLPGAELGQNAVLFVQRRS